MAMAAAADGNWSASVNRRVYWTPVLRIPGQSD